VEGEGGGLKPLVWRLNDLLLRDCRRHCQGEGRRVREAGGLHVVGTAIRESRRIDNQVRGPMDSTIICMLAIEL